MSQQLVLASANAGKLQEFREGLQGLGLQLLPASDFGITSFPEERGASYEENALVKAGYVALATGLPSLADDSGLEVDALGGAPGVYSARFGGTLTTGERIAHLLSRMRNVPNARRDASFVCSLVFATPSGRLETFRGECRGAILEGPRGEGGFGYDPVFYSPELGKTFAEAGREEKQRVSHRGRALAAFSEWVQTAEAKKTMRERTAPQEANLR